MQQNGDEIDMNFIIGNEGNDLIGKVPCDKSGVPLGISGVTVGNGYDIGQHSKDEVNRLNISPALKQKLLPYCNIKKQEALEFLKKNPIALTQQEAAELNKANLSSYLQKFKAQMNKYPQFYNSLTRSQKTVLFDFSYQQGLGKLEYFSEAFKENYKEKVLILLEQLTKKTQTKTRNLKRIEMWKKPNLFNQMKYYKLHLLWLYKNLQIQNFYYWPCQQQILGSNIGLCNKYKNYMRNQNSQIFKIEDKQNKNIIFLFSKHGYSNFPEQNIFMKRKIFSKRSINFSDRHCQCSLLYDLNYNEIFYFNPPKDDILNFVSQ